MMNEGQMVRLSNTITRDVGGCLQPGVEGKYVREKYGMHLVEVKGIKFWLNPSEFEKMEMPQTKVRCRDCRHSADVAKSELGDGKCKRSGKTLTGIMRSQRAFAQLRFCETFER